jgi:hypothetical protein
MRGLANIKRADWKKYQWVFAGLGGRVGKNQKLLQVRN